MSKCLAPRAALAAIATARLSMSGAGAEAADGADAVIGEAVTLGVTTACATPVASVTPPGCVAGAGAAGPLGAACAVWTLPGAASGCDAVSAVVALSADASLLVSPAVLVVDAAFVKVAGSCCSGLAPTADGPLAFGPTAELSIALLAGPRICVGIFSAVVASAVSETSISAGSIISMAVWLG